MNNYVKVEEVDGLTVLWVKDKHVALTHAEAAEVALALAPVPVLKTNVTISSVAAGSPSTITITAPPSKVLWEANPNAPAAK
jgi:hypothetical protein